MSRRPAQLLALNGPAQGKSWALGTKPTVLGRSSDCEISLDLVSISRRHAEFKCAGEVCTVKDLGSRNGVMVNGQLVQEAELKSGDVVSIGEVDFQFDAVPGAVPAVTPRPLTSRDLMAQGMAPGQPEGPSAPPPQQQRIGLNLKFVAIVVTVLVLSVVAGLLLLRLKAMNERVREAYFLPVLVKVGENRWVRVMGRQKITENGVEKYANLKDFSTVNVRDPEVAEAYRYDAGELVIKGLIGGETEVQLKMNTGSIIRIMVLVRGRIEDPLEALEYGAYSPVERNALADQFLANGMMIEQTKPYVALLEYDKAIAVLQPVPKGQTYIQAKERRRLMENTVNERWDDLKQDISVAMSNHDYVQGAQLLQEALQFVPDPNDPRRQKAEWFLRWILQQSMTEKSSGGRK